MARERVRLDHAGIAAELKSHGLQAAVKIKAEEIARAIERMGITVGDVDGGSHEYQLPVVVLTEVSDRARAEVILAHPAGEAVQAKHGALTKAAAQAGLEVHER